MLGRVVFGIHLYTIDNSHSNQSLMHEVPLHEAWQIEALGLWRS